MVVSDEEAKVIFMSTYDEWISNYKYNSTIGMCDAATKEMCRVFPELTRVPGHVYTMRGRLEHWWCVAPDGSVVDPTYGHGQFHGGVLQYDPVGEESEPLRNYVKAQLNVGGKDTCVTIIPKDLP